MYCINKKCNERTSRPRQLGVICLDKVQDNSKRIRENFFQISFNDDFKWYNYLIIDNTFKKHVARIKKKYE